MTIERPPCMDIKPVEGLKPRREHDRERISEIIDALKRYSDHGSNIPKHWVQELKDLVYNL